MPTRRDDGPFSAAATAIASSDRIRGLLEQMRTEDPADERRAELARSNAPEVEIVDEPTNVVLAHGSVPELPTLAIAPEPAPAYTWTEHVWVHRAIVATCIAVYICLVLLLLV